MGIVVTALASLDVGALGAVLAAAVTRGDGEGERDGAGDGEDPAGASGCRHGLMDSSGGWWVGNGWR